MDPGFENPLLFGRNPEHCLVAVEFDGESHALLYSRRPDGSTVCRREWFEPFLWSSVPLLDSMDLAGGQTLQFLTRFPDWDRFQNQRAALKSADFEWFAINDPVQQFLTSTGRTLFKGMEFAQIRRMQLDIETACAARYAFSNPDRDALTAIAISDETGWEEFIAVDPGDPSSEKSAIERLTALISERDPDLIEGHNIFKFDIPFLTMRAKMHRLRLKWGRDGSAISSRSSRLQIAEKTIQYPRCAIHGRHVVDTFILAQLYDVGTRELDGFGLKSVAAHFGLTEQDRVILDGDELQSVRITDPDRFRAYALQDVRETRALSSTLAISYFVQAQIFPYNFQDVITRGNATRINALFLRAYLSAGQSLPGLPEPVGFEGGYTDIFSTGVMRDVWHCDVASLYPSVILEFGLLPRSDSLSVFRSMLSDLRRYRLEAKAKVRRAVNESERLRFDALQSVFKILINSFYGYLGFSQGHFADFHVAAEVTSKGRDILRQMVDWLNAQDAKVIEIDTDGIYFQPPPSVSVDTLNAGMQRVLPAGIEVEFDKRYSAMFSYKAKNYALLDEHGRVTLKGAALKSRGMEPFLRDFLLELVRLLLVERPDALPELHQKFTSGLQGRTWDVKRFAKTEALQDSVAAYQKKIQSSSRNRSAAFEVALRSGREYQAGDQITYYITGTKKKVTAYDHAKPISEWDPAARDENVDYYVGKLDELYKKFADFAAAAETQAGFDF